MREMMMVSFTALHVGSLYDRLTNKKNHIRVFQTKEMSKRLIILHVKDARITG